MRNLARLDVPAVIDAGRLFANRAAEYLFERHPDARQDCLDAAFEACRSRGAHETLVAGMKMVFFPLFDEDARIEAIAGIAGGFSDVPRFLFELRRGSPRFSEILHQSPSVVMTARPNGQIDYLSRRWYEITGTRNDRAVPDEALASAMSAADYRLFSVAWTTAMARGVEFTLPVRLTTASGPRNFEVRARPIYRSHGAVVKWVGTLTDVEDAVSATRIMSRLKHRFEILAEAGSVVASARTLNELASGLTKLTPPDRAARWFIELRHPKSGIIVRRNLSQIERDNVDDALEHGRSVFRSARSEDALACTYVVAPIRTDETTFGFLGFIREDGNEAMGDQGAGEDQTLVSELATRAATGVERILSFSRDQELARMLQRSMLPLALPYSPGIRLDVAYEPAEREALVGGDWYDAFELPDGLIAIAIGDVAGHGFEAAIVMNQVRQSMRAAAMENADPASVLKRVNRIVTAQSQPMVTALFGVLDPLSLTFTCASAGHLPPVLAARDGSVRYLPCRGTPLGVSDELLCETVVEELPPGGALVLYTDGVVEDQRDFVLGEKALLETLASWARYGFALRSAELQARLRTGRHQDDAAMFILRFLHVDDFEVRLPATPYNAQRMRLAARRFVSGSPFDEERAFDAVLVAGEAVNNAVEHAYRGGEGFVTLALRRESERLVIDVRDEGTWREPAPVDRMHGLDIIDRLADKVEIRKTDAGTNVHIEMVYAPIRQALPV